MIRNTVLVAAALVASLSFAQGSATGTWNGKVSVKADLAQIKDAAQKKQFQQMIDMISKTTMKLNLKAGKVFTMKVTGMDMKGVAKSTEVSGTWSQKGNEVSIKASKNDGKVIPAEQQRPQTFILGKDGKTMTFDAPGMGAGTSKVTFTKV